MKIDKYLASDIFLLALLFFRLIVIISAIPLNTETVLKVNDVVAPRFRGVNTGVGEGQATSSYPGKIY